MERSRKMVKIKRLKERRKKTNKSIMKKKIQVNSKNMIRSNKLQLDKVTCRKEREEGDVFFKQ